MENANICLSGGAIGADVEWGLYAGLAGHQVVHWSFARHRTKAPADQITVLSQEQLEIADPYLEQANRYLQRKWPIRNYTVSNLLRRNYYQVRWTDAVYAVSHLDMCGQVDGGTAWATTMFANIHPDRPMYLFDQKVKAWYIWVDGWKPMTELPTRPSGTWAGIGSRKLLDTGREAIREMFAS